MIATSGTGNRICLMSVSAGRSARVKNDDEDMLEQAASLDDEIRNNDGDQVVDPPDEWIDVQNNGSSTTS